MSRKTFDQLFGGAKEVVKLTHIKIENYGNTAVKVLGMFHAFLRWKDKVYKQLFYITDCDRSPNLLSRDACYILGVLKPCYTVENPTVNASKKGDVAAKSFHHQKMNGSEEKLSNNSNKQSINKSQLQGSPLTKQDILDVYSDVFTGIGKFPGMPYKFQLKQSAKPVRHAPREVPYTFTRCLPQRDQEFGTIGNSWGDQRCDRMGEQLCNHGEEGPNQFLQDSNQLQQSRTLYEQEIKDLLGS